MCHHASCFSPQSLIAFSLGPLLFSLNKQDQILHLEKGRNSPPTLDSQAIFLALTFLFAIKLCQKMFALTSPSAALIYSWTHNNLVPALIVLPKSSQIIISLVHNPTISFQSSSSLASLLPTLFFFLTKLLFIQHFLWVRNCAKSLFRTLDSIFTIGLF